MEDERTQILNDDAVREDGAYVLYWMQQAQRADFNHALEHAIAVANATDRSVLVGFGLMEDYPDANARHFAFMLAGLAETAQALAKRKIKLVVNRGDPDEVALALAERASQVVCDRGYLRHQYAWRQRVAEDAGCRVVQVEGDAVVPVETASDKAEYAARTIRRKLKEKWDRFLGDVPEARVGKSSLPLHVTGDVDLDRWEEAISESRIDSSVGPVDRFAPGTGAARERLKRFLESDLEGYADARNDPSDPQCSMLSPYLHFGQISPVEIARACRATDTGSDDDREAYLEELIVRRELAINFVHFTEDYDSYGCLPDWARKSLREHGGDDREHIYDMQRLAEADTHDPAWNAAMTEMLRTGYMHNYMRMYWGKKIIEWSPTPEDAYETALALNNRYFLDGRDANSYANVGWLFGLHDRPWQEREIFGKVRYMNANGLKRKFDIDAYIGWAKGL